MALCLLPIVAAAGTHNVSVELLPPPDVITLITPPNNTVFVNVNEAFFSWNASNLYNSTSIVFRVYLNGSLLFTTNETNVTITGFPDIASYSWYVSGQYDNATVFSSTFYFRFTQDFYDDTGIYCKKYPTAEVCQTMGGAGAGLGMFIDYLGIPLLKLLILVILAAMVYIIGHAVADRINGGFGGVE